MPIDADRCQYADRCCKPKRPILAAWPNQRKMACFCDGYVGQQMPCSKWSASTPTFFIRAFHLKNGSPGWANQWSKNQMYPKISILVLLKFTAVHGIRSGQGKSL